MSWMDTYADQIGSWTLDYVPADVIEAMGQSHMLGIFFRLDSDPALHICMGINDIPVGIDGVDEDGTVYLGAGRLNGVPTLEVLVNGQADSVEFALSGIDPADAAPIIDELPEVRGKRVHLSITTLDDYYQPISTLIPIWTGIASHTSDGSEPAGPTENPVMSVSLAVVTGNGTRSRPSGVLWSAAHHRALYPTDAFCDGTARLARGVAPAWPDY